MTGILEPDRISHDIQRFNPANSAHMVMRPNCLGFSFSNRGGACEHQPREDSLLISDTW